MFLSSSVDNTAAINLPSSSVDNTAAINLPFVCLSADHSRWQLSCLVTDKSTAGGCRHTVARLDTMTEIKAASETYNQGFKDNQDALRRGLPGRTSFP
jgi:hypothetical protein